MTELNQEEEVQTINDSTVIHVIDETTDVVHVLDESPEVVYVLGEETDAVSVLDGDVEEVHVLDADTEVVEILDAQGPAGERGPEGPEGPSRVSEDDDNLLTIGSDGLLVLHPSALPEGVGEVAFTHHQGTAENLWEINHTLPFRPAVTVVDSSGRTVEGDITYAIPTRIYISFSAAFSGTAYLS